MVFLNGESQRTRAYMSDLIRKIKAMRNSCVSSDELITTFNALALPFTYLCVDSTGSIHYVIIKVDAHDEISDADLLDQANFMVTHASDVVWCFTPTTSSWRILKESRGRVEPDCDLVKTSVETR